MASYATDVARQRRSTGKQKGQRTTRRWKLIRSAAVAPLLFVLLGVLLSSCRTALTPLPPVAHRSYQTLLEWSLQNGIPGAILLVRTPRGEFLGSVGYADLKRHIPMRTNHAFQIGSVTKSFLGVACAQMHAEGILDLDACITIGWGRTLPPISRMPTRSRCDTYWNTRAGSATSGRVSVGT